MIKFITKSSLVGIISSIAFIASANAGMSVVDATQPVALTQAATNTTKTNWVVAKQNYYYASTPTAVIIPGTVQTVQTVPLAKQAPVAPIVGYRTVAVAPQPTPCNACAYKQAQKQEYVYNNNDNSGAYAVAGGAAASTAYASSRHKSSSSDNGDANMYVSLGLGYYWPSTSSYTGRYTNTSPSGVITVMDMDNMNLGSNIGFNAAIGTYLNDRTRLELNTTYTSVKGKKDGTINGYKQLESDSKLNVWNIMLAAEYDIYKTTDWSVFLGAGAGVAMLKSNYDVISYEPSSYSLDNFANRKTNFSYKFKIGTNYNLDANTELYGDVSYTYLGSEGWRNTGGSYGYVIQWDQSADLYMPAIEVGIRFKF